METHCKHNQSELTCWWQSSASIYRPWQSFPPKAGLKKTASQMFDLTRILKNDGPVFDWCLPHSLSPGVVALPCAMSDPPTTCPWTGGELGPAGPGAVHHHRGAELIRGHTATLQTPLQERIAPHEKNLLVPTSGRWSYFGRNKNKAHKWPSDHRAVPGLVHTLSRPAGGPGDVCRSCRRQGWCDRTGHGKLADGKERQFWTHVVIMCVFVMWSDAWWCHAVITGDLPGQGWWKSRLWQCYQRLFCTGHQLHSTDQASSLVGSLPLQAGLSHM